ncbi:CLUMA_CG019802, isoform A [Clunio marinus]|uniref:CLUMA_CG019802, isoform A n=1 Tax=Clunio marinus TaxID=568069 RepID=A0A1J1J2C9_9DIPT|nr:CLUMA_CG019802, isoform A [Clunio marinus]
MISYKISTFHFVHPKLVENAKHCFHYFQSGFKLEQQKKFSELNLKGTHADHDVVDEVIDGYAQR